MNNVLIIDDLISPTNCDFLIDNYDSKMINKLDVPWNYHYIDVDHSNKILYDAEMILINAYKQKYPEIDFTTDPWISFGFRIKKFKPGNFYDAWHSEHSLDSPKIACMIFYLSDHNCGTEFYNKEVIMSRKGRGMIFPASWTHTHKGQPCPDNKVRYIVSSYLLFYKN